MYLVQVLVKFQSTLAWRATPVFNADAELFDDFNPRSRMESDDDTPSGIAFM